MRVAYCQIQSHPSYIGIYGSYCREAYIDEQGAVLTKQSFPLIDKLSCKIEEKYKAYMYDKLLQLLSSLKGRGLDCIVFPEYSIPASCLEILYTFAQEENCICVAASHTIQISNDDIYKKINMTIDVEEYVNMSCCPIILPTRLTKPICKRYKSKWESNMSTEKEIYSLGNDVTYIEAKGTRIAVTICIDALNSSIDTNQVDLIISPAATPSTGQFKNKFESYLSQDIPTLFCNAYLYGGSTIFCHAPIDQNVYYGAKSHLIEMDKCEEAIVIVDIDVKSHIQKIKSSKTKQVVSVVSALPIYYRDNSTEISLLNSIQQAVSNRNRSSLENSNSLIETSGAGILCERKKYLKIGINNQSISWEKFFQFAEYIYINDFSLIQYEVNWIEKILSELQKKLLDQELSYTTEIGELQSALFQANSKYIKLINNKINLPVFDDQKKDHKTFQNRGGEIEKFRSAYQETDCTIYILNSFTGMGKSAFIDRLKFLYDFSTKEKSLSKSAGFESLLLLLCDVTKQHPQWDLLDRNEIDKLASGFAQALAIQNKSIVVIKSIGRIFDDYNKSNSILLLKLLAVKLRNLKTHIKIIIETNHRIPDELTSETDIEICYLKPLLPMFIGREIEQVANQITYYISMPRVNNEIITLCKGSPAIASLVGTYLGNKINKSGITDLNPDEISSFTNSYVDGILNTLTISDEEKTFLNEASVFRISVEKNALELLPSYSKRVFDNLYNKMLFEENGEGYRLISLISTRLYSQTNMIDLHRIAAQYYEQQNKPYDNLAKAEYFYHLSFCNPELRKKDIRYYSDFIMSAAIEISDSGKDIEIALSHLLAIKDWKNKNWRYNLYLSYCYIILDNYPEYNKSFELSCECNPNPESSYFIMIQKLITIRKLNEVETLLNTVSEKYGNSKQLQALWASYFYANKNTREESITKLIALTQDHACDIYAAKIIVRILLREGLVYDALREIKNITDIWKNNSWATNMKFRIEQGVFDSRENETVDFDDELN